MLTCLRTEWLNSNSHVRDTYTAAYCWQQKSVRLHFPNANTYCLCFSLNAYDTYYGITRFAGACCIPVYIRTIQRAILLLLSGKLLASNFQRLSYVPYVLFFRFPMLLTGCVPWYHISVDFRSDWPIQLDVNNQSGRFVEMPVTGKQSTPLGPASNVIPVLYLHQIPNERVIYSQAESMPIDIHSAPKIHGLLFVLNINIHKRRVLRQRQHLSAKTVFRMTGAP